MKSDFVRWENPHVRSVK